MLAEQHAEESAEAASNRFCFKILHATAGRIKTIGTFVHQSGKALEQDDVGITLHQVYKASTADELHMHIQPHVSNVGQHAQVFIARDFKNIDVRCAWVVCNQLTRCQIFSPIEQ